MPLKDDTREKIEQHFKKILEVLDTMKHEDNGDDALNVDEEALRFTEWLNLQTELRYGQVDSAGSFLEKKDETNYPIIYSGIYWAHLGRNIGDEMNKHRPVLVLRADRKSSMCDVIPLTKERLNDGFWYHVDLEHLNNTAVVEQFKVISKRRLDKPMRVDGKIATASEKDLERIYEQMKNRYATPRPRRRPNNN